MTERYLHDLWERKTCPVINHSLENGQIISVLNHGEYNLNNSGPDFKFGCVQIDNVKMFGHIELHIKSSDWYKHKHHLDVNYNNVILHVVYENDVNVIQNGYELPFVELKDFVNKDDYELYVKSQFFKSDFPCKSNFQSLDTVYFNSMITHSVESKFINKMKYLKDNSQSGLNNVLYFLLAQSFGTGLNKKSFEQLVKRVPRNTLNDFPKEKIMLLLLSESELLQQESLSSKNIFTSWHFKGTRPQNSPTQRVRQFIELATSINYNLFDGLDNPGLIKQVFRDEIDRVWNLSSGWTKKLSSAFIDLLLINAVAPYLWYCAEFYQKTYYHDLAIDLLLSIAPEKNSIIKKWYPLNVIPLNAFESQGLIGLYRYYCCRKKCLSCSVGQKLLNR